MSFFYFPANVTYFVPLQLTPKQSQIDLWRTPLLQTIDFQTGRFRLNDRSYCSIFHLIFTAHEHHFFGLTSGLAVLQV